MADPHPGHERLEGWLSIPYLGVNQAGEVECWGLRFRCLEDHDHRELGHGKYFGLPGQPTRMFNARAILDAKDEIHITEGELDAVILNQCGLPAVAIPGASNWKWHYTRLMAGFNKVFVWGDPDAAGSEFATTVTNAVRSASAVKLTLGDVNETFVRSGHAAVMTAREAVQWA